MPHEHNGVDLHHSYSVYTEVYTHLVGLTELNKQVIYS